MSKLQTQYMARSMTAFARQQQVSEHARFSWEIRSVNQRYLEINPRLPDAFRHLENDIRSVIKQHLFRGKLDVSLSFELTRAEAGMQVNPSLLDSLSQAINQVQQQLPEATQVNPLEILNWPGIMVEKQDPNQQAAIQQSVMQALTSTLETLTAHRQREGQALAQTIVARCEKIEQQLDQLQPELPLILESHADKLQQRIQSLTEQFDDARFHQELAIMAQKMDVAEEIDRLRTHLNEVRHILADKPNYAPIGRRLDFLMQELNREANTLGSKSIDKRISQTSVELKVLIEQMREQVQNIE